MVDHSNISGPVKAALTAVTCNVTPFPAPLTHTDGGRHVRI